MLEVSSGFIIALVNAIVYGCALVAAAWKFIDQFWCEDCSLPGTCFLSQLQLTGPVGSHKIFFGSLTALYWTRLFESLYYIVSHLDADVTGTMVITLAHLLSSCFYLGCIMVASIYMFSKLHSVSPRNRALMHILAGVMFCAMVLISIIMHAVDGSSDTAMDLLEALIVLAASVIIVLLSVSTVILENWAKRLRASLLPGSARGRHYVTVFQAVVSGLIFIIVLQTFFCFFYMSPIRKAHQILFAILDSIFALWLPEVFPGGVLLAFIMKGKDSQERRHNNARRIPKAASAVAAASINGDVIASRTELLLGYGNGEDESGSESEGEGSKVGPPRPRFALNDLGLVAFKNSYEAASVHTSRFRHSVYEDFDDGNNSDVRQLTFTPIKGSPTSENARPRAPSRVGSGNSLFESSGPLSFAYDNSNGTDGNCNDDKEFDFRQPTATEFTEFAVHVIYHDPLIDSIVFVRIGGTKEEQHYRDLLGTTLKEGTPVDGEIDRVDLTLHEQPESLRFLPKTLLIPSKDIECGTRDHRKAAPSLLLLALGHDPHTGAGPIVLGIAHICARNVTADEPISLLYKDTILESLFSSLSEGLSSPKIAATTAPSSQPALSAPATTTPASSSSQSQGPSPRYTPLHCVGSFALHKEMVHTLCAKSLERGSCVRTFACQGHITECDGLYDRDVTLNVCEELWESTCAFAIPHDIIAATLAARERQLAKLESECKAVAASGVNASPSELSLASFEDARTQQALSEKMTAILQGLREHVDAMKEYCRSYARSPGGRLGSSFKASVQKKSGTLRFNPTNLHVQFMTVFSRTLTEDGPEMTPDEDEDAAAYAFVTLGAPAAHGYQSGCEDGAYQLAKRIEQMHAPKPLMDDDIVVNCSLEEQLAVIVLDMVKDVVLCQIACALADAFTAEVELKASSTHKQSLTEFFEQVQNVGFLVCFESLLSTFGKERQILGDFEFAVCCLDSFRIRLVGAANPSSTSSLCIIIITTTTTITIYVFVHFCCVVLCCFVLKLMKSLKLATKMTVTLGLLTFIVQIA